MNQSRFAFPGFRLLEQDDNNQAAVERGEILANADRFVVDMILPVSAPASAKFLCASVRRNNKLLWTFKGWGFRGHGHLAMAGDEVVVALVNKDRQVEQVVPFVDMRPAGMTAPRGVCSKLQLKQQAAEFLGLTCMLTENERLLSRKMAEEHRLAEAQRVEEERKRKLQARLERRAAIMARPPITVVVDGRSLYGVPVLKNEWPGLDEGVRAVQVERFTEDGTPENPQEAFIIGRIGGKGAFKTRRQRIDRSTAMQQAQELVGSRVQAVDSKLFALGDDFFEVEVYASIEDVRRLRELGAEDGYVAVPVTQKPGKYTVLQLGKELRTVTEASPLAA